MSTAPTWYSAPVLPNQAAAWICPQFPDVRVEAAGAGRYRVVGRPALGSFADLTRAQRFALEDAVRAGATAVNVTGPVRATRIDQVDLFADQGGLF